MSQNSATVQANPLLQALKILGVAASASIDDVKIAYRRLVKRYHPDKTAGNAADQQMYQAVEWAYKTVTSAYQEWQTAAVSDQNQLRSDRRPEIAVPQIIAPDKFTPQHFNNTFARVKGATLQDPTVEHGVYDVDESQYRPRQMADYQRQHSQIEAEMQQTRPLFQGGFNQQVFNQTFEQQQALHGQGHAATTALSTYGAPAPQGGAIYAATPYTELSAQGAQRTVTSGGSAQYADNNWHQQAVPHATAVASGRPSYQGVDTPARARDLESRMNAYRHFDAKAVMGTAGQQATAVGAPAVYQEQPTPFLLSAPSSQPPMAPQMAPQMAPINVNTPGVYYRSTQQQQTQFSPPVQQQQPMITYPYQNAVVPSWPTAVRTTDTTPSNAMMDMWTQQQMMQMEQTQQMNRLAQMNQTYMNEQISMLKTINQVLNNYRNDSGPRTNARAQTVAGQTHSIANQGTESMSAADLKELQELRRMVKIQHALIDQIEKEGLPPAGSA